MYFVLHVLPEELTAIVGAPDILVTYGFHTGRHVPPSTAAGVSTTDQGMPIDMHTSYVNAWPQQQVAYFIWRFTSN